MCWWVANWNVPFSKIKLHDRDLRSDFEATLEDATKLGNEIAERFNQYQSMKNELTEARERVQILEAEIRVMHKLKDALQ